MMTKHTCRASSNLSLAIRNEGVSGKKRAPTRIIMAGTAAIAIEILQPFSS